MNPKLVGGRKLDQRAGSGDQRRGLVVVAVEGAEGPVQMRNSERCAEARADGIFGNASGEMRGANSGHQRQPGSDLEFVVKEECRQAAGSGVSVVRKTAGCRCRR